MNAPTVLVVEADILIRSPLGEYLRECGFLVLEASSADEARQLLSSGSKPIDVVLADMDDPAENGFALARWIRANHPGVEVSLAGTVGKAVEKAGDLCQEGPALSKPYDHKFVLEHIRQLLAVRKRL